VRKRVASRVHQVGFSKYREGEQAFSTGAHDLYHYASCPVSNLGIIGQCSAATQKVHTCLLP
jgi:hypothetical protein